MSYKVSKYPVEKLNPNADIQPGFAFKSERFTDSPDDIPLVKGENVHQGYIDWLGAKHWPADEYDSLAKYHLVPGDVVLAMDRPWVTAGLKWSYIKPHDPKSLLVQRVARIRAKKKLDQGYLRHVISSNYFANYLQPIVTGVNVPHISGKQIGAFRIPIPKPEIQRKIAAILTAYDDLIEINKRRIVLLEMMAKELYLEWFVRLRFPGHQAIELEMTPLREFVDSYIGGDWGNEVISPEFPNRVYVIRGTDFENVNLGDTSSVPERFIKGSSLGRRKLQPGDLIVENSVNHKSRTAGKSLLVTKHLLDLFDGDVICASFCKLIRPKGTAVSWFLALNFRLLFDQGIFDYFQNIATNGIANLQVERFLDRNMIPFSERIDLAPLSQIDPTVFARSIKTLTKTRDLLLPRLISGKLSVEGLDIQFPPSMQEEAAESELEPEPAHA